MRFLLALSAALWPVVVQAAAPVITNVTMVGATPQFGVHSDLGIINQIQYCTNLSQGWWLALTNVVVEHSPYWFVDGTVAPDSQRFYRVAVGETFPPLFYDSFTRDEASPMASPRLAEPGPGTITLIQADGTFSSYLGRCYVSPQTTAAWGDLRMTGDSVRRSAGRTVMGYLRYTNAPGSFSFGWDSVNSGEVDSCNIRVSSSVGSCCANGAWIAWQGLYPVPGSCDYEFAVVLQATGSFMLVKGGNIYRDWTLGWAEKASNAATLWPAFESYSAGGFISGMRVVDLGEPWTTATGIALGYIARPAVNETLPMGTNALIESTWQTVNGTTQFLYFRHRDASNCWYAMLCANGSGSSVDHTYQLCEVSNNVTTVRASGNGNLSTAVSHRVWVRAFWTDVRFGVDNARLLNCTSTMDTCGTNAMVSAAGTDFTVWPMSVPFPSSVSPSCKGILAIGDSKTVGGGDEKPENGAVGSSGYVPLLMNSLNTDTMLYAELPKRIATSGDRMADVAGHIVSDVSTRWEPPTYVLVNLGANDVASLPTATVYCSNIWTVVSTVKGKWPNSKFYFMRPWKRGYTANCDTLAGYFATFCASNSAYCFLGPDERVFLENGDDGTTYTADGTHPNHAGYALTAQKWKTVLGL
jgi:lysophospholipase L1-like esterase